PKDLGGAVDHRLELRAHGRERGSDGLCHTDSFPRAPARTFYDRLNTGAFRSVSEFGTCLAPVGCAGRHRRDRSVRIIRLESLETEDLRDYRDLTDVVL